MFMYYQISNDTWIIDFGGSWIEGWVDPEHPESSIFLGDFLLRHPRPQISREKIKEPFFVNSLNSLTNR